MHLSYACRAIIFFVYIFPARYYISIYVVFVCFCVIYSFITAVCYYFRFLFLFSTILLSHIKVLYAFVFCVVVREYPHRNERKMSIGGGWFIFTPTAGGCALSLRFHLDGGVAVSVLAASFCPQREKAAKPSKHSRRRFSRLKTKMSGRKTAATARRLGYASGERQAVRARIVKKTTSGKY